MRREELPFPIQRLLSVERPRRQDGIGMSAYQDDENDPDEFALIGRRLAYDSQENHDIEISAERTEGIIAKVMEIFGVGIDEKDLRNCGVIRYVMDRPVPTNAYALLCEDSAFTEVMCDLFKGCDRSELLDHAVFSGSIIGQFEGACDFVFRNIGRSSHIGDLREGEYEIPSYVVREAIANAVQHRSYADRDRPIQLALFDDRLEIFSPGASKVEWEDICQGRVDSRNPAISRFFRIVGVSEGWGVGIPGIIDECKKYGLPEPSFEMGPESVRVTIPRPIGSRQALSGSYDRCFPDRMLSKSQLRLAQSCR